MKLKTIFKLFDVGWDDFILQFDGFKKYINKKINILSGGEQRLIETYLVLKSKSNIVLLDEPFSHLAPLYIVQIKTIIVKEKLNKIIIITDHMYRHIIEISDNMYLLRNGYSKHINNLTELENNNYLNIGSLA